MMVSNQPYQEIHSQENSNSTIGRITRNTAMGLAFAGVSELGTIGAAKAFSRSKNPQISGLFHSMAYDPGIGNGLTKTLTSGIATRTGRIRNYGGAVAGGLLTGLLYRE